MTEEQIKHMAERFLGWPLPKDFAPDGGVTFDPASEGVTGTNLLTAMQAEAMVRYLADGLPAGAAN